MDNMPIATTASNAQITEGGYALFGVGIAGVEVFQHVTKVGFLNLNVVRESIPVLVIRNLLMTEIRACWSLEQTAAGHDAQE